jgi:hypothetical protein
MVARMTRSLITLLFVLTFAAPARADVVVLDFAYERGTVIVHTDEGPWRSWRLETNLQFGREDLCRWRLDARRVTRGLPVTQYLPRRCMSAWTKRQRPDAFRHSAH